MSMHVHMNIEWIWFALLGNDWTKRTEQPEAIQLVDAQMNWLSEHLMEFLLEQNEYRQADWSVCHVMRHKF